MSVNNYTEIDLLNHSQSYLNSAKILWSNFEEIKVHRYAPIFYLLLHSYELMLKAFLFKEGKKIETYRHDFVTLIQACKSNGLEVAYCVEYNLDQIEAYNNKHVFRYPDMSDMWLPEINSFIGDAENLILEIGNKLK